MENENCISLGGAIILLALSLRKDASLGKDTVCQRKTLHCTKKA